MIEYYLDLADECISLTYWKKAHKKMLLTLETMKNKTQSLKGGKQDARKTQ